MHIFAETKSVGEHNKERLIESDSPLYPLYIINKIDTPPQNGTRIMFTKNY